MSTREIDLGDSAPLVELSAPAQIIQLPRRGAIVAPAQAEPRRFSRLRLMDESPMHYELGKVEETSPMRKGTALHAYLLGQKDRVVVFKDGVRNPKHSKYKAFLEEHAGKCILNETEAEQVFAMRASVEKNPRALELLEGEQERRIEWTFGGRPCAGTPDAVKDFPTFRRVTELKATWCAKPARLIAHARMMHWHAQVSWYGEGLDRTESYPPLPCEEFYVVAVESRPPYPVTTLRVTPEVLAKGARLWRFWWEKLENCEQSQHFPGYSEADVEWKDDAPPARVDLEDWDDDEESEAVA